MYLSHPNFDADSANQRLYFLAAQPGLKVVVFPQWPAIDALLFEEHSLFIADMEMDLAINWPESLLEPRCAHVPDYAFYRCKDRWKIHYLGETIEPTHVLGMSYIAKALLCSPDEIPLAEVEQEITLSTQDQRNSGGLEARAEPNQNLAATTAETLGNLNKAKELLEQRLAEAVESGNHELQARFEDQIREIDARISADTFNGRIKQSGNEATRKRLSKNLNKAFQRISQENNAIGKYFRDHIGLKRSKLSHSPREGERWDVRI